MANILVAEDEQSVQLLLRHILEKAGHQVFTASDGVEAWELFQDESIELVIQDIRMPRMDGLVLLERIKQHSPEVPVVVITAFSNWQYAVDAMRLGAFDYIKKPFDNNDIRGVVERALQVSKLSTRGVSEPFTADIVGDSPPIRSLLGRIKEVARTDATVLIQGESGTGKELAASAIHYNSARAEGPFLIVNCGAFSETLLESELFGHRKGAFTGAYKDKRGYLELAHGGTLVLDEIGELPAATQVKFLRVIEKREFMPLGSDTPQKADIRFIGCTNRDLQEEVEKGNFRLDLFYRLNVIPLQIPPLRDRREDIPLLVGHFLAKYSQKMGKQVSSISDEVLQMLCDYHWPGNVRELENVIQRAVAFSSGDRIESVDLLGQPKSKKKSWEIAIPPEGIQLEQILEDLEKAYLQEALKKTEGNVTQAAKLLGLTFRSMRYKIQKYGLKS